MNVPERLPSRQDGLRAAGQLREPGGKVEGPPGWHEDCSGGWAPCRPRLWAWGFPIIQQVSASHTVL